MHDASKVLMGVPLSSARDVSRHDSDPAGFVAGVAVSMNSSGLSLLKSVGPRIGVSLGKSLSDTKKTAVCRAGESVPVKLALKRARGTVTITSYANLVSGTPDAIVINGTSFAAQAGAATPGAATFQAASSNNATATSLAAQINAHATIGALVRASANGAVVTIAAVTGGTGGNAITLVYTNNDANAGASVSGATLESGSNTVGDIAGVTKGAKVYFDDISGLATENLPGASISDATYVSGILTGIDEASAEVPACLVDMPGGL